MLIFNDEEVDYEYVKNNKKNLLNKIKFVSKFIIKNGNNLSVREF